MRKNKDVEDLAKRVDDLERSTADMSEAIDDLGNQLIAMARIVDKVIDNRGEEAADDLCKFIMRSIGSGDKD